MPAESATTELERFALMHEDDAFEVKRAAATPDSRRDGEPVLRLVLILSDPTSETWDIDRVRDLRFALGRKANELGLPSVSLTLIGEHEPEAADAFER